MYNKTVLFFKTPKTYDKTRPPNTITRPTVSLTAHIHPSKSSPNSVDTLAARHADRVNADEIMSAAVLLKIGISKRRSHLSSPSSGSIRHVPMTRTQSDLRMPGASINRPPITLVLDLDETLIFSAGRPCQCDFAIDVTSQHRVLC